MLILTFVIVIINWINHSNLSFPLFYNHQEFERFVEDPLTVREVIREFYLTKTIKTHLTERENGRTGVNFSIRIEPGVSKGVGFHDSLSSKGVGFHDSLFFSIGKLGSF